MDRQHVGPFVWRTDSSEKKFMQKKGRGKFVSSKNKNKNKKGEY